MTLVLCGGGALGHLLPQRWTNFSPMDVSSIVRSSHLMLPGDYPPLGDDCCALPGDDPTLGDDCCALPGDDPALGDREVSCAMIGILEWQ
ncbi:unnamed protein product [Urochloa humidicola]